MKSFENKYSSIDKSLHQLAFNSTSAQLALSDLENNIYGKKFREIEVVKPVFITALPRAGTTLLLDLLASTSNFVTNTYRDMPFFLIPVFWNNYSRIFKQSDKLRERAHGDGMLVSVDSPEAFEEIIWKSFWKSKYKKDKIIPWNNLSYPEFESFFKKHIQKTIFLKSNNKESYGRYISKNNLNIARTKYISQIFPDSTILILFRDPLQHASSLLRQHLNFLEIHKEDSFACKYMEAIGHYDFGKNIKPVDFNSWITQELLNTSTTLTFWLKYWTNSYSFLLNNLPVNAYFISFEKLYEKPLDSLGKISDLIKLGDRKELLLKSSKISIPKLYKVDTKSINKKYLTIAQEIYLSMEKSSIL